MKRLLVLLLVLGSTHLFAQFPGMDTLESPTEWTGEVEKEADNTYNLIFKAKIDEGWYVFSQHTPEGGSMPMEITYLEEGTGYETSGKTEESPTKTQFNEVFGVDEIIWEKEAVLTQKVNLLDADTRFIKAEVAYQVCDEVCINEEFYFVFDLAELTVEVFENYDDFESFNGGESEGKSNSAEPEVAGGNGFGFGGMMTDSDMESPTEWSGTIEKQTVEEFELIFRAQIDKGWYIFSQHTPEGGSMPLEITYLAAGTDYETSGETEESPTRTQFNEVFGVDEIIWEKEAVLTQKIKLKNVDTRYIKAEVAYQVCDEVCINEEAYFVFDLKENKVAVIDNYDTFIAVGEGKELPVVETAERSTSTGTNQSQWIIFISAFLWGFAALLTPCVFPMIPMTVSFFTKQSKTKATGVRNAMFYGISIILIYVILGTLIVGIFGADSLNRLSTNVTFNILFFLLLMFFAISFLGAFEIVLPSSWANKVDNLSGKGGAIGIFFMALALAIVSFSCTGPIIGTLLVQAASQGGTAPIVGMFGFSLALAIPFGLFALFPGWMNSLPKSGGWLNSVKVVLGFLELALAFKFLSNADLVIQGGYLPREIFLAIWIAIFGVLSFYLFGKIQLPNDTKPENISVGRLGMGLLTLSFTIYLIPGIWGAPLKMLSGYLPPEHYSESPYGIGYAHRSGASYEEADRHENKVAGPQNILAFRDYEEGITYAKEIGKPVMLDFTGMACVNCRKMEDRVWSERSIKSILEKDVVLISLYVDIDEKLPVEEQYTSKISGRRIRTVGNKWSDFQIERYQVNAQPYYVLLNPANEQNLNKPVGYVPDAAKYEEWLREGIQQYKALEETTADYSESISHK